MEQEIVETQATSDPPQKSEKQFNCDECIAGKEQPASMVCNECSVYLCDKHVAYHKESKATHLHQLTSALDLQLDDNSNLMFKRTRYVKKNAKECNFHPAQITDLYCTNCKSIVCQECHSAKSHFGHSFQRLFDCWETVVEAGLSSLQAAKEKVEFLTEGVEKVKNYRLYLDEQHQVMQTDILNEYNTLKEKLETELKEYQVKLQEEFKKTNDLYDLRIRELQASSDSVDEIKGRIQELLDSKDTVHLLTGLPAINGDFAKVCSAIPTPEIEWNDNCGYPSMYIKKRREMPLLESSISTGICMKESELNSYGFKPDNIKNQLSIDKILAVEEGEECLDRALFTWAIDDWETLKQTTTVYSPEFKCNGFTWKLLLYPKGNKKPNTVSLYLECMEALNDELDTSVCGHFAFVSCNYENENIFKKYKVCNHAFTSKQQDWGYGELDKEVDMKQISRKNSRPILENNRVKFKLYINVIKDSSEKGDLWNHDTD
ncbi:hypothetical protein HDV01_000521 [Terramyces sp. JEL0728]|nr:hypothetical protein HDV01_000521 [Terramyces sp. JEL0728]